MADLANYDESKEGASYVLDEQFIWRQSQTPTPGELNTLDEEIEETPATASTTPQILGVQTEEVPTNQSQNKNKYIAVGISSLAILGFSAFIKIKNRPKADASLSSRI